MLAVHVEVTPQDEFHLAAFQGISGRKVAHVIL
jgi:hypothetical protein